MFVVIFEVCPRTQRWDDYLAHAKMLRPELEGIEGFVDNERFASKGRKGWLVSLSTWRDEKAVIRWRTHAIHHGVQEKGRFEIFRDYHLRVGEIVSDTHVPDGQVLREQRFDTTEIGAAPLMTITQAALEPSERRAEEAAAQLGQPGATQAGLVESDLFENINSPGAFALLCSWRSDEDATGWRGRSAGPARHRVVRVIRDYGMADRREAPQFYPPAAGEGP